MNEEAAGPVASGETVAETGAMRAQAKSISNRHWISLGWCMCVSAVLLAGCSKIGTKHRLAVSGTVTLANQDDINGSISFVPAEGTAGPAAITTLAKGKFEFDRTNGPTAGPHRVIIRRSIIQNRIPSSNTVDQKADSAAIALADSKSGDVKTEWKLRANLHEDAPNHFDFKLEP
jgi:hypothetical protein